MEQGRFASLLVVRPSLVEKVSLLAHACSALFSTASYTMAVALHTEAFHWNPVPIH